MKGVLRCYRCGFTPSRDQDESACPRCGCIAFFRVSGRVRNSPSRGLLSLGSRARMVAGRKAERLAQAAHARGMDGVTARLHERSRKRVA